MSPRDGQPDLDLAALAESIRQLTATLAKPDEDEPLFLARRGGRTLGALLLKRTYKVERGACVLAPPDEQAPVVLEDVPYGLVAPPQVAPLIAVDEGHAWKPFIDVVIQARAYSYEPDVRRSTATVRFRDVERSIVVVGDRRGEIDAAGRLRFSEPAPFRAIPVRWDRAYGGFDATALRRRGNAAQEQVARLRPEVDLDETPFHYPRNPCGRGYLISLDAESFEGLLLPNLEHPFAELTPERLAVGAEGAWIRGPLPAAWDFQPLAWFPRCAYLGLPPPYLLDGDELPAEIRRGWATRDLLQIPPITHLTSPDRVRLEASQCAAPGMSFPEIAPDERFELENLHATKRRHVLRLPGEIPEVDFELSPGLHTRAHSHLSTVVLRVDLDEVELLWSARVDLPGGFTADDLLDRPRRVRWVRPKEKG
jgi:hypothetical protein